MTFAQAVNKWYEVRSTRWTSTAHAEVVGGLVGMWKRLWGPRLLPQITTADIEDRMVSRIRLGRSASRLNAEQVQLRCFFQWAMKHGLCGADPTEVWERRVVRPKKRPVEVTREMEEALIGAAPEEEGRFMGFLLYTGLRGGTVRRMTWAMVIDGEPEGPRMEIPGPLMKSRRDYNAPMSPTARVILGPRGAPGDLLFPGFPSEPAFAMYFARLWKKVWGKGPRPTPHDLRKTFATRLLNKGAAIPLVCELGDWASEAVLLRFYRAQARPPQTRAVLQLLNES